MDDDLNSLDDSNLDILQNPYNYENSMDSFTDNDYSMNDTYYDEDSCEDDQYYEPYYDNHDESTYESLPLALDEDTEDSVAHTAASSSAGRADVDLGDLDLEENNNDPNNNMDSIEIIDTNDLEIVFEQSSESGIVVDRPESPQPGCSKDFKEMPLSKQASSNEDTIQKCTNHIMHLISLINEDTIREAMRENPTILASDIKLWDLVPKESRKQFFDSKTSLHLTGGYVETKATSATVKRGSVEDICTVGCKKASSDVEISLPKMNSVKKQLKGSSHIPLPTFKPKPTSKGKVDHGVQKNAAARVLKAPVSANFPAITEEAAAVSTTSLSASSSKGAIRKVYIKPDDKVIGTKSNEQLKLFDNAVVFNVPKGNGYRPDTQGTVRSLLLPSMNAMSTAVSAPSITTRTVINIVKNETPQAPLSIVTESSQTQATTVAENSQAQPTVVAEKPVCMEIFYKIRMMFPNVDPNYLKKLCPAEWGSSDREARIAHIVEHLLQQGDGLPLTPVDPNQMHDLNEHNLGNADDICETLLGIFPDADPHFLRDFAVESVNKPNAVKEFIENKLENRDYPTREEYQARLKITEQQRQYTTGFDIKQYLTIIPNPFEYFMDKNRKCLHSTVAFEFLKYHCNKMRVATISNIYSRNRFNLSLTVHALELLTPEMRTKRYSAEMPTENITLLQEIAFIKHRNELRRHIDGIKRAEEIEFNMLKARNALLECQCCYDSECLPSKCSSCEFGHVFCNSCIVNGTSTKMGEGETRIRCFVNCESEFSLSVLQKVLAPTTFSILLKKRQAAEVMEAGLEGLVSCPFCHFASIPPEEDKTFKCLNPECTKESCRLCKELSHLPLKCEEVISAEKARLYIEERMTEAYARKCYNCQKLFIKEEGCNLITCSCGAKMCYICDAKVKDYSHFRGQGGTDAKKCPLYDDTPRQDALAVRKVAEQAKMEVMKLHPNLQINAEKLLPSIPPATNGPHMQIQNAEALPRRVQRGPNPFHL